MCGRVIDININGFPFDDGDAFHARVGSFRFDIGVDGPEDLLEELIANVGSIHFLVRLLHSFDSPFNVVTNEGLEQELQNGEQDEFEEKIAEKSCGQAIAIPGDEYKYKEKDAIQEAN